MNVLASHKSNMKLAIELNTASLELLFCDPDGCIFGSTAAPSGVQREFDAEPVIGQPSVHWRTKFTHLYTKLESGERTGKVVPPRGRRSFDEWQETVHTIAAELQNIYNARMQGDADVDQTDEAGAPDAPTPSPSPDEL